jgi:hypothetical protein
MLKTTRFPNTREVLKETPHPSTPLQYHPKSNTIPQINNATKSMHPKETLDISKKPPQPQNVRIPKHKHTIFLQ